MAVFVAIQQFKDENQILVPCVLDNLIADFIDLWVFHLLVLLLSLLIELLLLLFLYRLVSVVKVGSRSDLDVVVDLWLEEGIS